MQRREAVKKLIRHDIRKKFFMSEIAENDRKQNHDAANKSRHIDYEILTVFCASLTALTHALIIFLLTSSLQVWI